MTTPFELMVAPTGARRGRTDHPAVPLTPDEIVQTVLRCADAGANRAHLHVRTEDGAHSLDPAAYDAVLSRIGAACPILCQVSTEAAGVFGFADQYHCLRHVSAQDASVSLREIMTAPDELPSFYAMAAARGIDIQHILYDPQDIAVLADLMDRGVIPSGTRRIICVLGRYAAGQIAEPADLAPFLTAMRGFDFDWTVCAFGPAEQDCLLAALDHGGNVRVGFENNLVAPNGRQFTSNEAAVATLVNAAARAGFAPRSIAA